MPLTRGELIRTGFAGSVLLAAASCAHRATAPRDSQRHQMIAAIAGVMLAGALPPSGQARTDALGEVVRGVDIAIAGLPPVVQGEISQLFGLLSFPLTRVLAAGVMSNWGDAPPREIETFLRQWRYSSITLFRSGYDALHQLVMAGWYGNDLAWPRIGYGGPPKLS